MKLWIKDPLAVLADGAERGLVIEDGRISALVAAGKEPEGVIDQVFPADRHVVLPGLINTHHHFYQTLTRSFPAALDKKLFPWLEALYPVWAGLDEAALRSAVQVAMAELMLSGCTTAADHHYVFPKGLDHAIDIEVEEAKKLGLRAVFTRGSMNLSVKDGGLPPDSVVQDEDTILADSERLIGRHHQTGDGAMIQIALAPCSPFSVTGRLMKETAILAEKHGVRLHTHLAETEDENAFCLASFGCRPLDYLEDCGWLSDKVWLAHGIHFTEAEITRLGKAGTGICHCPSSNQVLASGICPAPALERAGSPVGLGVDGSASADSSNLIQEVRAAFLLQRLANGAERISHKDALRYATAGSAACIGRPDLGTLAVGKAADIALFKLDELRFAGRGDPLAALVLCGAHRADHVMAAGRWIVTGGRIPGLDLAELLERHRRNAARLARAL
ncbi:8-oxoguanine deaminase [Telmatospirillum siberiense]|uniref:8-oxoguanine deaminase n=1 Tax=Telmatospirillum siberiense TaxID=382514 RepID=A0A2N3PVJ1_9PROT|nr:8-oxoguanine deaminase [Telmatospirillum siberiense]PKU24411.1 8-oxoguanine deaminase [Telmatospirillum siberiense]